MSITTYTVIGAQGPLEIGLTCAQAALAILTDDSARYEIRHDIDTDGDPYWQLWHKTLNGQWTRWLESSFAETENEAESEIFAQVVTRSSTDWPVFAEPEVEFPHFWGNE